MVAETESGLTAVEECALVASPFAALYPPAEKIRTIVVDNFPALGKLAAMRFLEWVQTHPGGVISLPTGKTPEHFIKWVTHLLTHWNGEEARAELEANGIDPGRVPDMRSLHFVQIDEFYPIEPSQHNSFHSYVNRFYTDGFGLDPAKALLMNCNEIGLLEGQTLASLWPADEVDLSLRYRAPSDSLERTQQEAVSRIDQWCHKYEDRIRDLGGIGFFMGGIGPDGHIGFNVRGSDHHSTTRLTEVNYETQAAAAGDLGGIEISRKRLVITIGLGTITYDRNCCALVIAAGEAKAGIVAGAIEAEEHVEHPATALHLMPNARFYITAGAAKLLGARQLELVVHEPEVSDEQVEKILIDLSVKLGKKLDDLSRDDLERDPFGAILLQKRAESVSQLTGAVRASLIARIEHGSRTLSDTRFLHTEPHHDDLMLGYLPYIVRHVRDASNSHNFVCLTGGFTAVTNHFIQEHLARLKALVDRADFVALLAEGYFEPGNGNGRNRDVWQYLDGVAADDPLIRDEGAARRFLRNLIDIFGEREHDWIKKRIETLEEYFASRYPGQKDVEQIQRLKAMCREWEAECIWGYFGWNCDNVEHLQLKFYTGDIFTEEPTMEGDVQPVLELMQKTRPDLVSVALDPEASGPDTHYKVLQAVTEALKHYEAENGRSDLKVWGYRNVWFRFHPSEANIYVPVSLNMFSIMHSAFMNTFISQSQASFPSYEHDGPFSELAQRVQVDQYQMIKTCLGREWFHEHPSALIRGTRGLVFLKEMDLFEFYARSRELKQAAENK